MNAHLDDSQLLKIVAVDEVNREIDDSSINIGGTAANFTCSESESNAYVPTSSESIEYVPTSSESTTDSPTKSLQAPRVGHIKRSSPDGSHKKVDRIFKIIREYDIEIDSEDE